MATASAVLACSVADPYLVLLMEDGSMQLMMVEVGGAEEGSQTRLMQSTPQLGEVRRDHSPPPLFSIVTSYCRFLHQMSKVVCVSAFVDISGMFTTEPTFLPVHNVGGVRAGDVSVKQEVSEGESPGKALPSPLLATG